MKTHRRPLLLICCLALLTIASFLRLNAQEFTNHTYQTVTGNFTWHQARADAEARGGHLATITSQGEFDHIVSLGILPDVSYWLGATDEAQEGVWSWVTGEAWEFSLWSPGEPNNQGPENYLVAGASSNRRWNDWG